MATAAFNTLKYAKRLEAVQFSPEQAEVQSEVLAEVLEERDRALAEQAQALAAVQIQLKNQQESHKEDVKTLATKGDLRELDSKLSGEIALVRKDVEAVEQRLNARMDAMENRMIIKLGGLMVVVAGIAFAAMRWMPHA